jgi:hypothetical protein
LYYALVSTMGTTLGKQAICTALDVKVEVESFGPSYEKYGIIVVNEGIDGEMILALTENDLVELGVTSSLHRKKLLLRTAERPERGRAMAVVEQGKAGSGLGRRPLPCQCGSGAIAPV